MDPKTKATSIPHPLPGNRLFSRTIILSSIVGLSNSALIHANTLDEACHGQEVAHGLDLELIQQSYLEKNKNKNKNKRKSRRKTQHLSYDSWLYSAGHGAGFLLGTLGFVVRVGVGCAPPTMAASVNRRRHTHSGSTPDITTVIVWINGRPCSLWSLSSTSSSSLPRY